MRWYLGRLESEALGAAAVAVAESEVGQPLEDEEQAGNRQAEEQPVVVDVVVVAQLAG